MAVTLSLEPVQLDDLFINLMINSRYQFSLRYSGNNYPTFRINYFDKQIKTVLFWTNKEVYIKKNKNKAAVNI